LAKRFVTKDASQWATKVGDLHIALPLDTLPWELDIASTGCMYDVTAQPVAFFLRRVKPLQNHHMPVIDEQVSWPGPKSIGAPVEQLITAPQSLGGEIQHTRRG
jgi:hypothetical protein